MTDIYEEIIKIKAEGEEAALVTVISTKGSTPRKEGTKMLVRTDGSITGTIGGGNMETQVIEESLEAIRKGISKRLHFSLKEGDEPGMICGGDTELFIEPITAESTMYIFGGGHIALTLAKIASLLSFKIVVIDDRPEYANAERFPEAEQTLVEDFSTVFQKLKINKSSYLVIVTYNHKGDEIVLEQALSTGAKYIGMIGSKMKNKTIFSHLLEKGISQEQLDRVHAPIGVEINAQTPEEIAISIMAEIIQIKRSDASGGLKSKNNNTD
jgi:xanthine dehydrogenase accessory factor